MRSAVVEAAEDGGGGGDDDDDDAARMRVDAALPQLSRDDLAAHVTACWDAILLLMMGSTVARQPSDRIVALPHSRRLHGRARVRSPPHTHTHTHDDGTLR